MDTVTSLWLVPLVPLVAGAVSAFLPLRHKQIAFGLAVGSMIAALFLSASALLATLQLPLAADGEPLRQTHQLTWMTIGSVRLQLGVLLDPLTATMITMVSFVGLLIFVYSRAYMAEDSRLGRFFAFLALFAGGMLGLCVANSLVMLFISWEIVGVSSYLLIGFWFHKPSAAAAAKKAFLVTKLGDMGFFVGMLWLYGATGSQLFYDNGLGVLEADVLRTLAATTNVFMGLNLAGVLALLLFCGAIGKSGQFPLHVWLPDAMEGPTPVSALIHAATMVAAGVFLVGRTYPLFLADAQVLQLVTWLGAFTALLAASIAVAQNDIKRILAYSTVSQLGLMMLGLGAAGFFAGIFHLITHAFFKALLFLGAGSVIHACDDEQDIRKMGGLRKHLPITFWTYLIGALALAGMAPLAGFWSKDAILFGAFSMGQSWAQLGPFAVGVLVSLLTAFYMTRQVWLVFFGASRAPAGAHAHESPPLMTVPLIVLAVFAALLGLIGGPFHHFLAPKDADTHAGIGFMAAMAAIPLIGIGAGWLVYGRAPLSDRDPLSRMPGISLIYGALEKRWYWDEIYEATVVRGMNVLAWFADVVDALLTAFVSVVAGLLQATANASRAFDTGGVQGAAKAFGASMRLLGRGFSLVQTGRAYHSLAGLAVGVVLLLAWLAWLVFGDWFGLGGRR